MQKEFVQHVYCVTFVRMNEKKKSRETIVSI